MHHEPVCLAPMLDGVFTSPSTETEDWEKAEISSLLKEAQTLRSQKEQLEAQIAEAEDANASLQSSWGALSRVSTALAAGSNTSSQRPSPLKVTQMQGFSEEVEPLPLPKGDVTEKSEVQNASEHVQVDVELLRSRLAEAEVAVIRDREATLALELQECQAKELAKLLKEIQVLHEGVDHRSKDLVALTQKQEKVEQELVNLTTSRSSLQEEHDTLEAQRLTLAEAMPKAVARHLEATREVFKSQQGLRDAKELWRAQVSISQRTLQVEEKELSKLAGRREASELSALEGRRATSDLSSKMAMLRLEYQRLLNWRQAHSSGQSVGDHFGLEAQAEMLKSRIQSLEEQLRGLRSQEAQDQATLRKKQSDEALQQRAWEAKNAAEQEEARAFEACGMRLHELQREMTQETKSLELELQDEFAKLESLRSEVLAAKEVAGCLLRRSASAPQLSWRDVFEQHRDPEGRERRSRKKAPKAPTKANSIMQQSRGASSMAVFAPSVRVSVRKAGTDRRT